MLYSSYNLIQFLFKSVKKRAHYAWILPGSKAEEKPSRSSAFLGISWCHQIAMHCLGNIDAYISARWRVFAFDSTTPQVFSHVLTGWEHPLIPMIVALVSSRSATSHPRNYLDRHIVIPAPSVRHMKLAGVNYLSCRAEKKGQRIIR